MSSRTLRHVKIGRSQTVHLGFSAFNVVVCGSSRLGSLVVDTDLPVTCLRCLAHLDDDSALWCFRVEH